MTKEEFLSLEMIDELQRILSSYSFKRITADQLVDIFYRLIKRYDVKPLDQAKLPIVDK
jgi:hypothetical protein